MLFRLLKNASKWVFKQIEDGGRRINEAEERLYFGDKDDSNKN
jgi:hypothetical protein